MKLEVSEKIGNRNFGVFWISLDGRLMALWFQYFKDALSQHDYLREIGREPSLNIRFEEIQK